MDIDCEDIDIDVQTIDEDDVIDKYVKLEEAENTVESSKCEKLETDGRSSPINLTIKNRVKNVDILTEISSSPNDNVDFNETDLKMESGDEIESETNFSGDSQFKNKSDSFVDSVSFERENDSFPPECSVSCPVEEMEDNSISSSFIRESSLSPRYVEENSMSPSNADKNVDNSLYPDKISDNSYYPNPNNISDNSEKNPVKTEQSEQNGVNNIEQLQPKLTSFLIENILKPEFGNYANNKIPGRSRSNISVKNFPKTITDHSAGLRLPTTVKNPGFVDVWRKTNQNHDQNQPLNLQKNRVNRTDVENSVKPRHQQQRSTSSSQNIKSPETGVLWPAWVYCTRYSDRPSAGPRSRKVKKRERKADEKRPRTAFTNDQLQRLKKEFDDNRYLTEQRRQRLATELQLNESQIKIWFQNKRAKLKKTSGARNPLAVHLMAQGLYNHSGQQHTNDCH